MDGLSKAQSWTIVGGPEPMVPWADPDDSCAWLWTLQQNDTGEMRELCVRVSWKGFETIDDVPSLVTRYAFAGKGSPGVTWFLDQQDWAREVIFHSQSQGPHGSTGSQQVVRT